MDNLSKKIESKEYINQMAKEIMNLPENKQKEKINNIKKSSPKTLAEIGLEMMNMLMNSKEKINSNNNAFHENCTLVVKTLTEMLEKDELSEDEKNKIVNNLMTVIQYENETKKDNNKINKIAFGITGGLAVMLILTEIIKGLATTFKK